MIRRGDEVVYVGDEPPFEDAPDLVGTVGEIFEEGGENYATVDWPGAGGRTMQGIYHVDDLRRARRTSSGRSLRVANPDGIHRCYLIAALNINSHPPFVERVFLSSDENPTAQFKHRMAILATVEASSFDEAHRRMTRLVESDDYFSWVRDFFRSHRTTSRRR